MSTFNDANGIEIEVGMDVAILLPSGRPSRSEWNQGVVLQCATGKSLIERNARPESGAIWTRDWFDNDTFVIIKTK
jgi:hypothetical protein